MIAEGFDTNRCSVCLVATVCAGGVTLGLVLCILRPGIYSACACVFAYRVGLTRNLPALKNSVLSTESYLILMGGFLILLTKV